MTPCNERTQGQKVILEMCLARSPSVTYDEHLGDAIEIAFHPLADLTVPERSVAIKAFVSILRAGGLIAGEDMDGLLNTSKTPGIQKLVEAVYSKVRTLREADDRLATKKKAAAKKQKAARDAAASRRRRWRLRPQQTCSRRPVAKMW